jgi:hypothetical protein
MSDGAASSAGETSEISEAFELLSRDLRTAFASWESGTGSPDAPWPEALFSDLALRAFTVAYEGNAPFRHYCDARGSTPRSVDDWRRIPSVPTAAFRSVDLIVGGAAAARLVFRTSGTTGGRGRRGRHPVRDPSLYRASLRAAFRRFVLADGPTPLRVLVLHAPFEPACDSSLAWMLDDLLHAFGDSGSGHAWASGGFDWDRVASGLRDAIEGGIPVAVLGTTLAFAEWLDTLDVKQSRFTLPEGSLVMDTGGAKGRPGLRRRLVAREVASRLALPESRLFNEFGMTELLSQRYGRGVERPSLYAPPWLRTRALDPVTLEDKPEGEEGILCHVDLANAGSVPVVLTEDRGRIREGAVEWLGRTPGAPPRGCSLATAELLQAQGGEREE